MWTFINISRTQYLKQYVNYYVNYYFGVQNLSKSFSYGSTALSSPLLPSPIHQIQQGRHGEKNEPRLVFYGFWFHNPLILPLWLHIHNISSSVAREKTKGSAMFFSLTVLCVLTPGYVNLWCQAFVSSLILSRFTMWCSYIFFMSYNI